MKPTIKALIYSRVSGIKQRQKGESPEHQIGDSLRKAKDLKYKKEEIRVFDPEVFTGKTSSRPVLDEIFEFIKNNSSVECVIFKCIDRFARNGKIYREIKEKLASLNVKIIDADGIIQPSHNILENFEKSIGTKLRAYDWAEESPSDMAEALASQVAEDERRRILKRTIPRQMELAAQGAIIRPAVYGYKNVKLPHPDSKKIVPSQEIVQEEAHYIVRAFQLKAQGWKSIQVVDELNNLGYRPRKTKKWNKEKTHIIGSYGRSKLNVKRLTNWLSNVKYAGFNKEDWTGNNPILAIHEPIVSLKLWNKANQHIRQLVKDNKANYGWRLDEFKYSEKKRNYSLNNPNFPFKDLIKCPNCGKNLKGSASKGKSGKYFPSYHCSREHKRISINSSDLQETLTKSLEKLTFDPCAAQILEITLGELWNLKLKDLEKSSTQATQTSEELQKKAEKTLAIIETLDSEITIKAMEKRYINIQKQIEELETIKLQKRHTKPEIQQILKHTRYFVEHLDKLVLKDTDRNVRGDLWKLVFPQNPTLKELQNGTPQISPIVELKEVLDQSNAVWYASSVDRWNTMQEELIRWGDILPNALKQVLEPEQYKALKIL